MNENLYADFLAGISFLLPSKDRVKLLRLALDLAEPGTAEDARILFELVPFLSVDDKLRYGSEALNRTVPSLRDLVVMLSCFDYLPREDTVKKIKSSIDPLERVILRSDSDKNAIRGFASFVLQECLALIVECESDSVLVTALIAKQEELLRDAMIFLEKSLLWSSRVKLAQAWILYSRAIRISRQRMPELFRQSVREAITALRVPERLCDYKSLFSGYRLLFLISYRTFLASDLKTRENNSISRRMRKYSELSSKFAEAIVDPVKLASAESNIGATCWAQAQLHSDPSRKRRLLEEARQKYLNAVLAVKGVSKELTLLPLFNAGSVLISLSALEQNVVKYSELLETALGEIDDVIKSSSDTTAPRIRVSAIAAKLLCMDELARITPPNVTNEVLRELDRISGELERLRSRTYDSYLFACAYENLSLYCLRLLRVRGKEQKQLLDKAEKSALRAYEIAEEVPLYDMIGAGLYNIGTTQMIRAILGHDVKLLTEAGRTVKRSSEVLERTGGFRFLTAESFGIEIQVTKYGYTGDLRDLDNAIDLSRKTVPEYVAHRSLQMAGEESFRLATLYMLRGADRKAERTLNAAAKLFQESGNENPQFSKESQDFSITCIATRKLLQAQIAFKAGKRSRASRLVEEAEREMTLAKARWREVWLIRGFKELIAGNLHEARTNLARIIKESLDVLEDKNPTSTGYTARRLVEFMNQGSVKRRELPPTAIDLPLKSEAILAALRLEKLSKEISSASAAGLHVESRELDIGDIRDIIKRLTETEKKEEEGNKEKTG